MPENQTSMIFRIDADLKKAFETAAKAMDQTASQLLRAYVRHIVEQDALKNAQKPLPLAAKPEKKAATPPEPQNPPKKRKKGPFDTYTPPGMRK